MFFFVILSRRRWTGDPGVLRSGDEGADGTTLLYGLTMPGFRETLDPACVIRPATAKRGIKGKT
jgi:hypothetical protein